MYYVIQRYHNNPQKHYLAYTATKFIAANNIQNIIFEFMKDGAVKRKWAPKDDIILITKDQHLFRQIMEQLESTRKQYLEQISAVQEQLEQEIADMSNTMNHFFEEIKQKHPSPPSS